MKTIFLPRRKPILFLRFLFLQTDRLLEVELDREHTKGIYRTEAPIRAVFDLQP